jgi:phosphate/sulfate permease
MVRNFKRAITVLVVLILAASTFAFAAANTTVPSAVGYLAKVVDGYAVTQIVYDLNAVDPTTLDKINFTITPIDGVALNPALVVKVQYALGGSWKVCTLTPGVAPIVAVVCDYSAAPIAVTAITALNIVASSSLDP